MVRVLMALGCTERDNAEVVLSRITPIHLDDWFFFVTNCRAHKKNHVAKLREFAERF
jgi:hypothetical protein